MALVSCVDNVWQLFHDSAQDSERFLGEWATNSGKAPDRLPLLSWPEVTSVYEDLLDSMDISWQNQGNFGTPPKPTEITKQGYFLILLAQ